MMFRPQIVVNTMESVTRLLSAEARCFQGLSREYGTLWDGGNPI